MTETMCTSGSVKLKAGANVSSALTGAHYTTLINQAESHINSVCRINYTDTYAALNADVGKLLEDAASSLAAVGAINYDPSGYTTIGEATTLINVNINTATKCLNLLRDKNTTDFVTGA